MTVQEIIEALSKANPSDKVSIVASIYGGLENPNRKVYLTIDRIRTVPHAIIEAVE